MSLIVNEHAFKIPYRNHQEIPNSYTMGFRLYVEIIHEL